MEERNMRIIMHGHHADRLFSFLLSLEGRIEEIKENKPKEEHALRLRLIQDVTDLLPKNKAWVAYIKARAASDKAWTAYARARAAYDKTHDRARAAYSKAWAARDKAWAARDKAWDAYAASFDTNAFHEQYCVSDCPWDGRSIWPTYDGGNT